MSGPRPLPPNVIDARGTHKPTRARHNVVPHLDGEITIPTWCKGRARKLFIERCAVYAKRRQAIVGCEENLAHYCCLSVRIEEKWKKGIDVTASEAGALRMWAGEFFDTPSTQVGRGPGPDNPDNPFTKRGKPKA